MSITIRVLVKVENTLEDKSAALGILSLEANTWSANTWKSFTGTESGFGRFSGGEWIMQLGNSGPGQTIHYQLLNEDKKLFLTLVEIHKPNEIKEGEAGKGQMTVHGGGTLPTGPIDWQILGAY